jgi:archaellum component FlaD/FlaE
MTVIEAINDTAKSLQNLAKVLTAVAEQTKGIPAYAVMDKEAKEETLAEKVQENVPKAEQEKKVTIEDVRAVMREKNKAGKMDKCQALLREFGAVKLSDIPEDKMAELLARTEAL